MPSLLQKLRMEYQPPLPHLLMDLHSVSIERIDSTSALKDLFPHTWSQPLLKIVTGQQMHKGFSPLRVGFVFSGGQAAGGHNVASGLFDALKKLHPNSRLFGFLEGPKGIIENQYREITSEILAPFRNQGGFDLIGSGRTKIETDQQFKAAEESVRALDLDGLVIIGGDDSNTNAALLTEYFLEKKLKTRVVGVPKTIDGDLKNAYIEMPFGFDSATKTYSEIIGNILTDAISAKKYTFFIKLMGRTASHIALECAMKTHANLTFIGEEVALKKQTVQDITNQIADLIVERSKNGKDYGVILIPEGLIEFIPECKQLIKELNALLAANEKIDHLSEEARKCLESMPEGIQKQLLLDRDSHGNVQVSKIDTERFFIETVQKELARRKIKIKFSPQPMFCGYEGRACLPTNFDSNYCYALGHLAAILIQEEATGYICSIQKLHEPVEKWELMGVPLVSMIHMEERQGKKKPVIQKSLVDLNGKLFNAFKKQRDQWRLEDDYQSPGPIQFFGPFT